MFAWLKRRLGLKDRILFHCPRGQHAWRQAYGDERMHYGKWHCYRCPTHQDHDPPGVVQGRRTPDGVAIVPPGQIVAVTLHEPIRDAGDPAARGWMVTASLVSGAVVVLRAWGPFATPDDERDAVTEPDARAFYEQVVAQIGRG